MDDDDDNNNVNKYENIGGESNGSNNEAVTVRECKTCSKKGSFTTRLGEKIRHLGNISFYCYVIEQVLFNVY